MIRNAYLKEGLLQLKFAFAIFTLLLVASCSETESLNNKNSYYTDAMGLMDGVGMNEQSEKYTDYGENPFVSVKEEDQSTFGIDADGGSYSNTRRFLAQGILPPSASVRVEEYINYFTFDYADPNSENVAINTEAAVCPWNSDHYLLRIGLKGKSMKESEIGGSNFVFLVDVSGSMGDVDKLELLQSGLVMLVDELEPTDRIAIVTYASSDEVVLESTPCKEKDTIKKAIRKLSSGGSTAGAQGIITAYDIAQKTFVEGGNNRIIIGSDGDFNVGPSSTEELVKLIEEKRKTGIYLTVLGFGTGNLNDAMMEQLANNGNGNYEYIDNIDQMKKVFIYEKQKFYTVAEDCKIQITFNEASVDSFRLIGYENRVLENEDFEKDTVDAGEIGAGQTITALYEIVPKEKTSEGFCTLQFRYKKPGTKNSLLLDHTAVSSASKFEDASENMRFVSAVAGFGMLMKESKYKGNIGFNDVIDWANDAKGADKYGWRNEFVELVEKAKKLD
jgi:Ca-activated chloride channel family protein